MARNWLDIDDEAIRGMAVALKGLDKDVKQEWAKAMRGTGSKVWASAIAKRKRLAQDKVFGKAAIRWTQGGKGTATVNVVDLSGYGPKIVGTRQAWAQIDFGSKARSRQIVSSYQRSGYVRKDGARIPSHRVGSHARRPTLPASNPTGRVAYGAIDPLGKYMGQMALKTLADAIRDAVEEAA